MNGKNSAKSLSRREVLSRSAQGALALGIAPSLLSLAGCAGGGTNLGNGANRSVSYQWTETLLEAISAVRPGPPMTARAIGMVATAAFDAWAAYDRVALGTRLGHRLRRPAVEHTHGNKSMAVSFAAYRVLVDLYPTQKPRFDAKMTALGYNFNDTSVDPTTPQGVGNLVADALLMFRHADGSNQAGNYADTTGYVPVNTPDTVNDPSKWQPLRFENGASPGFIAPHWGNVVPFALSAPAAVRPTSPPIYGTPTYLDQLQEVVDVLSNLDNRSKVIAEYWADGPGSVLPPGHWQQFGQFVSIRDNHTLDQDIKMFFMLGNAVFDSSIACWDCKRTYNTSRPITGIRHSFAGRQIPSFGGPNNGIVTVDGAQWYPYQSRNFITPPFPEYTSGHSTFSSSSAEILKRFTGSDFFGHSATLEAGWSTFENNVPSEAVTLRWNTFTAAANEAGMSRLYGGIHIRAGNHEGLRCGRQVGEIVWDVCMSYIDGSAGSRIPG